MDTKGRVALIDGDIVAFQVSAANQKVIPLASSFDEDEDTEPLITTDGEAAWASFQDKVETYRKITKSDHVVMTLTCPKHNWRKDVLPTYKSNRKGAAKPILLNEIKAKAEAHYKTYIRYSLEADDVLGILQTNPAAMPNPTVIVSIDKDLCTIPGMHYRPNEPERGVFQMTEPEANRMWIMQTLTGDATDGYKGCPGVGPVKADKLLSDYPKGIPTESLTALWNDVIVPAFEKSGLTEEDALQQARVAKICRSEDYNFKTKEVTLWTPTPNSQP